MVVSFLSMGMWPWGGLATCPVCALLLSHWLDIGTSNPYDPKRKNQIKDNRWMKNYGPEGTLPHMVKSNKKSFLDSCAHLDMSLEE